MNKLDDYFFNIKSYSSIEVLGELLGASPVFVEFWISRYVKNAYKEFNICYGLISEISLEVQSEWRKSDFVNVVHGTSLLRSESYKVAKISIVARGEDVGSFVGFLLAGKNLKDLCTDAALPEVPKKIHCVKLLNSVDEGSYVFRPPITALPKEVLNNYIEYSQGYSSPIQNSLATVGSLYLLDKERLWRGSDGVVLKKAKQVIQSLTQYLNAQTGLRFTDFDLKRLGNIRIVSRCFFFTQGQQIST